MPGGDGIRDVQRAAWAGPSAGWEKWDSVIMDQLGTVGTAMIEALGIADDQQHLDIAAGTGEPGLTVARLAPGVHVVLTDLAAEIPGIATRRANAQGITNCETGCAAPTTCHSVTRPSTVSRYGSDTCSFPTSPRRPPSSRACSSRAGVCARRSGSSPRKTRGRRSPCRHRGGGGPGAARPGRAGHVAVRCPGICQCPVPGGGAGRRCRVGRRRRARDAIARAVLGDDQRARLARGCGASQAGEPRGSGSRKPSSPGPTPTNTTAG